MVFLVKNMILINSKFEMLTFLYVVENKNGKKSNKKYTFWELKKENVNYSRNCYMGWISHRGVDTRHDRT